MSEITEAIEARQVQIAQLQREIDDLRQAASILGGTMATTARATPDQPTARRKRRPYTAEQRAAIRRRTKASWKKRPRRMWTTAEREAIGKRTKAAWAKRKRRTRTRAEREAIRTGVTAAWAKKRRAAKRKKG